LKARKEKNKMNKIKINTEQELEENWKNCFIIGLPKSSRTKKKLIEAFRIGITIWRKN